MTPKETGVAYWSNGQANVAYRSSPGQRPYRGLSVETNNLDFALSVQNPIRTAVQNSGEISGSCAQRQSKVRVSF
jgi:hypothetical protein